SSLFPYTTLFRSLPYLLPLLIINHYIFLFILCSICIDYTFFCILLLIYYLINIYQSYIIPYISSYMHAILCPYIPLMLLSIGSVYRVYFVHFLCFSILYIYNSLKRLSFQF